MYTEQEYLSAISGGDHAKKHYLASFRKFDAAGGKFVATWNWPAFLVTGGWTLYRGLYGWFFINTLMIILGKAIGSVLLAAHASDSQIDSFAYAFIAVGAAFAVSADYLYYKKIHKKLSSSSAVVGEESINAMGITDMHSASRSLGTSKGELTDESGVASDEDWAVAIEHFPELNKFEETLSLYPDDLAEKFRSHLLTHKTFGQADAYAQALISSYLDRNFGSNVCVREFGRRLTENSEIMAAEELAKTVRVLGASVQCDEIKRKIVEKYSLKSFAYFDDRFDETTDSIFPWAKSIPFYYRVASDGKRIHFQTNDVRLPNYVAESEDEAELIVRKIIEDDVLVVKKTAASLKRGRNFLIFMAVVIALFLFMSNSSESKKTLDSAENKSQAHPQVVQAITKSYQEDLKTHIQKYLGYVEGFATRKKLSGTAIVRYEVNRDGELLSSIIVKSTGNLELDEALLKSIGFASPVPALPALHPTGRQSFTQTFSIYP